MRDGKSHSNRIECSLSKNGMRIGSETRNRTAVLRASVKVHQKDERARRTEMDRQEVRRE